jgi:hypothetical protein
MEAVGVRLLTAEELALLIDAARAAGTVQGYKAAFGFAGSVAAGFRADDLCGLRWGILRASVVTDEDKVRSVIEVTKNMGDLMTYEEIHWELKELGVSMSTNALKNMLQPYGAIIKGGNDNCGRHPTTGKPARGIFGIKPKQARRVEEAASERPAAASWVRGPH